MTSFEQAYKNLNSQQKLAVDTIDGPVMVIAGPGTGKTQLLSVRVANILAQTDSLPDNILCLTFTEAAATEMRDRLVSLIGQSGYDINVLTFHAFGTEIINRYPEYFYQGADMQPIDEVSSYDILSQIFAGLPHSNPLSVKYIDEYTYLSDSQRSIGQLKKAAITPDKLRQMLDQQQEFIDAAQPIIAEAFGTDRISKKILPQLSLALEQLKSLKNIEPYFVSEFSAALESGTTPPISAWKRKWMDKTKAGDFVLKDSKKITKLRALAEVYDTYQSKLAEGHFFDYDDMVMQVVEQLTNNLDLRAELQEQYLYVLVDEFQDTNDAQLKLLKLLADNPANNGHPNILVVGDDDQAIYKFQGADITNMHQFASWVDQPTIVPLNDIYRYSKPLLDLSKQVIDHAEVRLTDQVEGINKDLRAVPSHEFSISRMSFEDEFAEYDNVARQISRGIENGTDPKTIAVIARQHDHLQKFSQYAAAHDVPINYERRDDVLEQPIIKELIHFAEVIVAIAKGDRKTTNSLMPELLSYEFWKIPPVELWRLNAEIVNNQTTWLDVMIDNKKFAKIAEKLLDIAQSSIIDPLSVALDKMIGSPDGHFYKFYFDVAPSEINENYLQLLSSLKTIRQKVVQYSGEGSTLENMLEFIQLQQQAKIRLVSTSPVSQAESSVSLVSAHGAKGLEFDDVYILHAQDSVWGAGKRGQSSKLSWTSNLNISPAGDDHDDRVRLFYVALTRAKHKLVLSSARMYRNKASLPLRLLGDHDTETAIQTPHNELAEAYILDWTSKHFQASKSSKAQLTPYLENYRLSITHLQNFVDVTIGGPTYWLIYNLLRFPGPSIPAAAYGSAIHATLSEAQKYLTSNGKYKSSDELIRDFEKCLHRMNIPADEFDFYLERGRLSLEKYLRQKYPKFKSDDKSEVNFYGDNIVVGEARLTGMADRINILDGNWQTGEIEVIDFKTGKSSLNWKGKSEFDKIKLHRYKQQLLFYELMIQKSKRFKNLRISGSRLEFVEPDENDEIISLELESTKEDIERLEMLIEAVWQKIQSNDLPNISSYSDNLAGVEKFEQDLIDSV